MKNLRFVKKGISLCHHQVSGKYRIEAEIEKSNVNDLLDWLSIVQNVTPLF